MSEKLSEAQIKAVAVAMLNGQPVGKEVIKILANDEYRKVFNSATAEVSRSKAAVSLAGKSVVVRKYSTDKNTKSGVKHLEGISASLEGFNIFPRLNMGLGKLKALKEVSDTVGFDKLINAVSTGTEKKFPLYPSKEVQK